MENHNTAGIDLDRDQVVEMMLKNDMLTQIGYRALMDGDSLDADLNFLTRLVQLARRSTSRSDDVPECGWCNDTGILGSPPDRYEDCSYCAPAKQAGGSDGTAAAGVGRLPAFTPSEQQYADWCERHDLPDHLSRDAFDDATSLYLTATSGSELADERAVPTFDHYSSDGYGGSVLDQNGRFYLAAEVDEALAQQAGAPADFVLVPKKITPEMIEAAMIAHYGKRRVAAVGGAGGIDMTVNDTNFSGVTAMRNFWRGALAAAPAPAAQSERDAKDAARYRWLRDVCPEFEAMASPWLYDDLDKAIDAAMSHSQGQQSGGSDQ